jgi:hypothetical protein
LSDSARLGDAARHSKAADSNASLRMGGSDWDRRILP